MRLMQIRRSNHPNWPHSLRIEPLISWRPASADQQKAGPATKSSIEPGMMNGYVYPLYDGITRLWTRAASSWNQIFSPRPNVDFMLDLGEMNRWFIALLNVNPEIRPTVRCQQEVIPRQTCARYFEYFSFFDPSPTLSSWETPKNKSIMYGRSRTSD